MSFIFRIVVASLVGCLFGYFGNKYFGESPAPQVVEKRSEPRSAAPEAPKPAPQPSAVGSSSDEREEPLFVTGIGYKLGRVNVTLSDGSHRTEVDGTVLYWGRNFVDLSDLGRLWVRPKPNQQNRSETVVDDQQLTAEKDTNNQGNLNYRPSIEDVKSDT